MELKSSGKQREFVKSTLKYHQDNDGICDVIGKWYVDGKPTGKGTWEEEL